MTELITEILIYLAIAALLGLALGYLIWGWDRAGRLAAARAEGAANAPGPIPDASHEETERLEREIDALRRQLAECHDARTAAEARATEAEAQAQNLAEAPAPFTGEAETALEAMADPETAAPPPASLLAERPEEVDDLKTIKGVGPVMEQVLNDKGVYLFHQIANFTPRDVAWVNEAIEAFPGRIERDEWVKQAQALYLEKYGRRHDEG